MNDGKIRAAAEEITTLCIGDAVFYPDQVADIEAIIKSNCTPAGEGGSRCDNCGGEYRFDTSIPSPVWNEVVRAKGGSEFLCIQCVVLAFVQAGRAVRATLWGDNEGVTETEIFIRPKGTDESHAECHAQEERLLGRIGELHNKLAAIRAVPAGDLVSRKAVLEIISQTRVGERDSDLRSIAAAIHALAPVEQEEK